MASVNVPFIESKLTEAARLVLEAQTAISEALESLEDCEEHSTEAGIKKLFDSTGALLRAANREKLLVKHGDSALNTANLSRLADSARGR